MFKKLTDRSALEAIEVLRFPLMILVLFIHVLPFRVHAFEPGWDADRIYDLVSGLISHHLGRTAVPCFFLFSGYFFFLKIEQLQPRDYAVQLGKRWRTLMLPYLLWNILLVLVVLLKNAVFTGLGMAQGDLYAQLQRSSVYDIIWGGPFLFPLWFLRDLICMTILSPLFYLLFRYTRVWGLLLLGLVYLLAWESGLPGLGTTAFLFFGAGAFLGLYNYSLSALGNGYGRYFLISALLFLCIAVYFSDTAQYEYWIRAFVICGVICWIRTGNYLLKYAKLKNGLKGLSSTVFFIYAVHELYIINWLKGGFSRLPFAGQGWGKLIAYFSIPVLCLFVCLGLYRLLKTFFPGLLAMLTGGRITLQTNKRS